jgi:hypothetical protein
MVFHLPPSTVSANSVGQLNFFGRGFVINGAGFATEFQDGSASQPDDVAQDAGAHPVSRRK